MLKFSVLSKFLVLAAVSQALVCTAFAATEVVEAQPKTAPTLRGPSPSILDQSRQGYFTAALGPAYGVGFGSDALMYNIHGAYNFNINERVTAKGIADLYLGSGSVSTRMMNFGVGADIFLPEINPTRTGIPYVSAEASIGNGRDAKENTGTGLALGTAFGYKFQVAETNLDVAVHYALLTATVGSNNPSVLGVRLGAHF